MIWTAKNLVRQVIGRQRLADPAKTTLTPAVNEALALPTLGPPKIGADPALSRLATAAASRGVALGSRELFSLEGQPLPCWLETDVNPADNWATTESYYPLFFRLYQEIALLIKQPHLLEIGVRTGYMGVTFARAVHGSCHYLGVDPNLYVTDGLDRAKASLSLLRSGLPTFNFECLLGYSDNAKIRRKIRHRSPFHIIHVDGDHTLRGKLQDLEFARTILRPDGFVLVDDYDYIPAVIQEAVSRALRLGWYSRFAPLATHRGLGILQL